MGSAGASGSNVDGVDLERTTTTEEESRTRCLGSEDLEVTDGE